MKKKYKIVLNIGDEDETILYYERYTNNLSRKLLQSKSYIVLSKNIYNVYMPLMWCVNEKQKEIYTYKMNYYCEL